MDIYILKMCINICIYIWACTIFHYPDFQWRALGAGCCSLNSFRNPMPANGPNGV